MAENKNHTLTVGALVLDCAPGGAGEMARFYSELLGWPISHPAQGGGAGITSPQGMVMAFQEVADYRPPVWPWQEGQPGQMLHFDLYFGHGTLEAAVAFAESCGARLAPEVYFDDSRTLFDPAGHPFCVDTPPATEAQG